jgi:hypothetical protein
MADSNLLEQKLQDIVASAGGDGDLRPPDDCRDKLGWYLDLIGELLRAGGGGSGGGGVTTHRLLSGRDQADQHPMSAITGLQTALTYLEQLINQHKSSTTDHEDIRTAIVNLKTAVDNLNIPNLAQYRTASAQDAIDNQITQTVTEHIASKTAHDIDEKISEALENMEPGSGTPTESITNAEIQEIINSL